MSSRADKRTFTIAIRLPDLSGGGAELLHIRLAHEFLRRNHRVSFVLDKMRGELLDAVPAGCPVINLACSGQLSALFRLRRFLKRAKPDLLIANTEHHNLSSVLAALTSRTATKVIASQHNSMVYQAKRRSWKHGLLPLLSRMLLPFADAVVCVSNGVATELASAIGLRRTQLTVIHNGVVTSDFSRMMKAQPNHKWLSGKAPVIVGMGRLVPQKDFRTLITAFAEVRNSIDARLIIFGEGPLRTALEEQAARLGISEFLAMPGYVSEPIPNLKAADLFVLSSSFEGFGNVVAEALACGTPVASTDCPHGPAEILEGGRLGRLVEPGDHQALAKAMIDTLKEGRRGEKARIRRGRDFSVSNCADQYVRLFSKLMGVPA